MEIPEDLKAFLARGDQLFYDYSKAEPEKIELCSLNELSTGVIWLAPEDEYADGYHEIPALNLVSNCETYEPDYILLWLPNEKLYGAWDCDHWQLTVFKDTTWTDIVKNPLPYINAQWYPGKGYGQLYRPYSKYPFKQGMPF